MSITSVNLFYPYIEEKALIDKTDNTQSKCSSTSPGFKSRLSRTVIKNFAYVFVLLKMRIYALEFIKYKS